ncbi:ATP-dependent chaperone ClpB [Babesia caballi]|uniref:ATP-dependent chaperone ClpB n=1 Tax=Babesia caballi TaxID=5871 RepID=A0AAV4LPW5_BABCB|nr:ATP-dependent chaperone ClpB [Babesia caballi]
MGGPTNPGAQQTNSGSTSVSFGNVDFYTTIIRQYFNNMNYYNDMYQANNNVDQIQGLAGKLLTEETLAKVQSGTGPTYEKLKEAYEVASKAYNELRDQLPNFQLVWDAHREYNFARRELTRKELTEVEKDKLKARMSEIEKRFRGREGFVAHGQLYTFTGRCNLTLFRLQHLNEMVEKLSSEEANVTGGEAASPIPPEVTTASSDNGKVAGKGTEDASEIKEPSAAATAELDNNGHVNEMASTGGGILRGAPVTTANNSASSDKAA